jgi:hypothetical protein
MILVAYTYLGVERCAISFFLKKYNINIYIYINTYAHHTLINLYKRLIHLNLKIDKFSLSHHYTSLNS